MSLLKNILVLLLVSLNTGYAQFKSDTLSVNAFKKYEETKDGRIVEKTIVDYKIKVTEITNQQVFVPSVLLSDERIKTKVLRIMDSSKTKEVLIVSKKSLSIQLYKFWLSPKILCDEYSWKEGIWSVEKDKIVSVFPTFENFFWVKFVFSILVLASLGALYFHGTKNEHEPIGGNVVLQLIIGYAAVYLYFMSEQFTPKMFTSLLWIRMVLVNYVIIFFGGYLFFKYLNKTKKSVGLEENNILKVTETFSE